MELLMAIALTNRQSPQIPISKGALMPRDHLDPNTGVGDDPFTVHPSDLAVLQDPLAVAILGLALLRAPADLGLRLQINALLNIRPGVDANIQPLLGKPFVAEVLPLGPPLDNRFAPIKRGILQTKANTRASFIKRQPTKRHHHVGMGFAFAIGTDVQMHTHIRNHPPGHKGLRRKIPSRFDGLGVGKLPGNGELDLATKARILSLLTCLDLVPQHFAACPFRLGALRQQNFRMEDSRPSAVVEDLTARVI